MLGARTTGRDIGGGGVVVARWELALSGEVPLLGVIAADCGVAVAFEAMVPKYDGS